MAPPIKAVRVLVVDDSAFMRHTIRKILGAEADLDVVGEARDGVEGLTKAAALRPDVITLDVEMPRLDGLAMLRTLMQRRPTPVVMLSTLTQAGASATLEALDLGAVDFVTKPGTSRFSDLDGVRTALVRSVRAAAISRVRARAQRAPRRRAAAAAPAAQGSGGAIDRLVVIGCSTGGPPALAEVIPHLPVGLKAPVVVVQHMPAGFTATLAERLHKLSALPVHEARDGELLQNDHVYMAPGSRQLEVRADRSLKLSDAPPVHGVRPSVDFTLGTISPQLSRRSVVAILTGMGKDGADGARRLRQQGAKVVVQDESTCTVYGMPRAVVELGAADQIVPLEKVAATIQKLL